MLSDAKKERDGMEGNTNFYSSSPMLRDASWKKAARSRRTWRMGSKPFNAPSAKKIHTPTGTISPGSVCLP